VAACSELECVSQIPHTENRTPKTKLWKPSGWMRALSWKQVATQVACEFESHGFRFKKKVKKEESREGKESSVQSSARIVWTLRSLLSLLSLLSLKPQGCSPGSGLGFQPRWTVFESLRPCFVGSRKVAEYGLSGRSAKSRGVTPCGFESHAFRLFCLLFFSVLVGA